MASVSSSSSSSDSINEAGRTGGPATPSAEKAEKEYFEDDTSHYEPIRAFTKEERPELARLASMLSRTTSRQPPSEADGEKGLERKDTLAGVEFGDLAEFQ